MRLDGYHFRWNKILIIFREIDDKVKGKERPFDQTPVWKQAKFYMDFYRNVDEEPKADKIPLKKSVEALEKKLEKNKDLNTEDLISLGVISGNLLCQNNSFSNTDSGQFSQESSSSSSLRSILSTSSKEEDVQQEKGKKTSRIPILTREKSNVSVSTIGLSRTSSASSLFTNKTNAHLESRRIKQIYKNKYKQTIDVVLSEKDPFLDGVVKDRKKPAISFRECIRVANVSKEELLLLNSVAKKKTIFLGNR